MDPSLLPPDPSTFPPEYVNASNAGRIVGIVGFFHFLALTFVSLRLYVRVFMVRAFGVDDALILMACVRTAPRLSIAWVPVTNSTEGSRAHVMDLLGSPNTLRSRPPRAGGAS
jgi:hypothetical protein